MFGKRRPDSAEVDQFAVVDVARGLEPVPAEPLPIPVTPEPEPELEMVAAPALTPSPPVEKVPDNSELSRLRDILFGGQARSTDKRISDLEERVELLGRELKELVEYKVDTLDKTVGNQLTATRTDFIERLNMKTDSQGQNLRGVQQQLTERVEQQNIDLLAQIRTTQRELSSRLESQQTEQTVQLRDVQKELTQRLDALTADFMSQLRQIQKELSDRLDKLGEIQADQYRTLQSESKKRDDDLRRELVTLAGMLESKKVSRGDLGLMLAELGRRLQNDPG